MMFEDEYVDVDSEIKVRRPAPSDDAPPWMRPVPVCKVDNADCGVSCSEFHHTRTVTEEEGGVVLHAPIYNVYFYFRVS